MKKEILLLPEFELFIRDSKKGKRRTASGKRISKGTIEQYETVRKYLAQFEKMQPAPLRMAALYGRQQRLCLREKRYWKKTRAGLESFLRDQHDCYDVYIASVFKTIKAFFSYLRCEKGLPIGDFHKELRAPAYVYQPVLVGTGQLQRLIADGQLRASLTAPLREALDLFLFGCVAGLRYSDLLGLKKTDVLPADGQYFLRATAQKTGTPVLVPLPGFAIEIMNRAGKNSGRYLFRRIANSNFNLNIRKVMERAGYTQPLPKYRYRKNVLVEVKTGKGKTYRFCDHISAHTMRRTAITTLLVLGVPEQVVRKVSGHAPGSKEFYRYVSIAQDYASKHLLEAYDKLLGKGQGGAC